MDTVTATDVETTSQSLVANGLKRRQSDSEPPDTECKRPRVSPGKTSPAPPDEEEISDKRDTPNEEKKMEDDKPAPQERRKKIAVTDEKQRSKRLFGALLGNLNQPSDRVSKRRQEIESRRKAELQRQDDERLEDKQRRMEKLLIFRKKEQVVVDEQNVRSRHRNILHAANFLQTTAEPKLYYRPWELRADEDDRVDRQIDDVKALIKEELAELGLQLSAEPTPEPQERNADSELKPDQESTDAPQLDDANDDIVPDAIADTVTTSAKNEGQVLAKSETSGPVAKPAEVPDSDTANHSNGVGDVDHATTNASVIKSTDAEEEGDHVMDEGEDTVAY